MRLLEKQRAVTRNIAGGVLIVALAMLSAIWLVPPDLVPAHDLWSRLRVLAASELLLAASLVFAIASVVSHRFCSPEDMDGSGLTVATPRIRVLRDILQNTLEQAVLAAIVHVAWAILAPAAWMAALPMAGLLFVAGSILFWRGYAQGAPASGMGFALTFLPTLLLFCLLVGLLATGT